MAKFYGAVGYGETVEKRPGVSELVITERKHYGDIIRNARRLDEGAQVLGDITTNNSISIVADAYALNHFFAMKYVEWANVRWVVSQVEVQAPRLILRLGGVYNGPLPTPPAPAAA